MDQDSEAAAQLEKIKSSCTGEKCEIDPKTLFTDEECPGIFSTKNNTRISRLVTIVTWCHNCDPLFVKMLEFGSEIIPKN